MREYVDPKEQQRMELESREILEGDDPRTDRDDRWVQCKRWSFRPWHRTWTHQSGRGVVSHLLTWDGFSKFVLLTEFAPCTFGALYTAQEAFEENYRKGKYGCVCRECVERDLVETSRASHESVSRGSDAGGG